MTILFSTYFIHSVPLSFRDTSLQAPFYSQFKHSFYGRFDTRENALRKPEICFQNTIFRTGKKLPAISRYFYKIACHFYPRILTFIIIPRREPRTKVSRQFLYFPNNRHSIEIYQKIHAKTQVNCENVGGNSRLFANLFIPRTYLIVPNRNL